MEATTPQATAPQATDPGASAGPTLPLVLRALHWFFIVNFVLNVFYGAYQVFVVLAPEGGAMGPLGGAATGMPHEQMVVRRAYAMEVWLSIVGLSLYLAITEYLPRLLRRR